MTSNDHKRFIYTSLTRCADLANHTFRITGIPRTMWQLGDFVATRVIDPAGGHLKVELANGRMTEVMRDDLIVGALGERFATLEATGSWKQVGDDNRMHLLTGAGLLGKLTSKSFFVPQLIEVEYLGHLHIDAKPSGMSDFIPKVKPRKFERPVVLFVGTSMSAGKTTAARIVTHQLATAGYKVVGAKLTGAGRYRDILTVLDAGASAVYDFVDVGLPSTICDPDLYLERLKILLSLIAHAEGDLAVIEIGASPLEPYNGRLAIEQIKPNVGCTVLCASDPYAVLGVMESFQLNPTFVTGIATNTFGGIELIHQLCHVKALNIINPERLPELRKILDENLNLQVETTS